MKRFAVVGNPLHHSLSPEMFRAAFSTLQLDFEYTKEEITPQELKMLIDKVRNDEYQGLSITVPYKEAVMPYLDELTPQAKSIKAVNTILKVDYKIVGENTDWAGFKNTLTEQIDITNKTILIYGAGGSARACLYALNNYKSNTFITNRTERKGTRLAEEFGVNFVSPTNLPTVDVFINATSAGLSEGEMLVPKEWLITTSVVFDLLYGETLLSKTAKELGLKVIDGKKMLLYQAALQFRLFTGLDAPRDVMAKAIWLI